MADEHQNSGEDQYDSQDENEDIGLNDDEEEDNDNQGIEANQSSKLNMGGNNKYQWSIFWYLTIILHKFPRFVFYYLFS